MIVWCWKSIFKEGRLWRTHCLIRFFQDLRIGKMDKENDRIHGMVKMSLLLLFFFSSCGRDPFGTQPEGSVKRGRDQKLFLSQGINFGTPRAFSSIGGVISSIEVVVTSAPQFADIFFYISAYPSSDSADSPTRGFYLGAGVYGGVARIIRNESGVPFSFFDDFYYPMDRFLGFNNPIVALSDRVQITEQTPIRNALFFLRIGSQRSRVTAAENTIYNGRGVALIGIKEVNFTNVPPYIVFDYVVNHLYAGGGVGSFYHEP